MNDIIRDFAKLEKEINITFTNKKLLENVLFTVHT